MEEIKNYKLRAAQLMHLSQSGKTLVGYGANKFNTNSITFGILKDGIFTNKDNISLKIYEHYAGIAGKEVVILWKSERPGTNEVFADLMDEKVFSYNLNTSMPEDKVLSLLSYIENEFYKKNDVPNKESINNQFELIKKH